MNLPNTKPNQYDLAWYIRECEALQNENAALRAALARWQKLADMGLEDVVPLWMRGTVANIAGQGDNALSLRQSRDHLPHGGLPETTGGDRTADRKEAQP